MVFYTKDQLRDERESLGLTQTEFGNLLGVTYRTVGNWEGGHTPVPKWLYYALKGLEVAYEEGELEKVH